MTSSLNSYVDHLRIIGENLQHQSFEKGSCQAYTIASPSPSQQHWLASRDPKRSSLSKWSDKENQAQDPNDGESHDDDPDWRNIFTRLHLISHKLNPVPHESTSGQLQQLQQQYTQLRESCTLLQRRMVDRQRPAYVENRLEKLQEEEETLWEEQLRSREAEQRALGLQSQALRCERKTLEEKLARLTHETQDLADTKARVQEIERVYALRCEEERDMQAALRSLGKIGHEMDDALEKDDRSTTLDALRHQKQRMLDELDTHERVLEAQWRESKEQRELVLVQEQDRELDEKCRVSETTRSQVQRCIELVIGHVRDTEEASSRDRKHQIMATTLSCLHEQSGEMNMSEMQQDLVQKFPHVPKSEITRSVYSLVASGLVAIDRGHGKDIVTSLVL